MLARLGRVVLDVERDGDWIHLSFWGVGKDVVKTTPTRTEMKRVGKALIRAAEAAKIHELREIAKEKARQKKAKK